jgi:hypothetical protein
MARIGHDKQTGWLWPRCTIGDISPAKNPHFWHVVSESVGIWRMYRVAGGGISKRLATSVALVLLAAAALWLGLRTPQPRSAQDFEECIEQVQAKSPSDDERATLMTDCYARFAGRRKLGGGYAYYDFMQDRNFDIAGPNPTAEERKQIDLAYMAFLDSQRRESISAELGRRHYEQLRADLESARQPVGAPLVLTPRNSVPIPVKRPADRSKSPHCEDGSLTCSWAKLSAVVKNAFASSPQAKP